MSIIWDMHNPAQTLLLEYLQPEADARILVLEGDTGWLAMEAARKVPKGKVLSLARDVREVWGAQTRLESISNADTAFDVFPSSVDWDMVLLTIPKERRFTRTLLLAAWQTLKPGGRLLLAGPSKSGAKAAIKDAGRLFGSAKVLGYRRHQRVAACTRGNSLPDPLPKEFQQIGVAPDSRHFIKVAYPEGNLMLETHPGIFSWEKLDEGTKLLLDHLEIEPGLSIWDVGCGYGAIGFSEILAGAGLVAMSDVNLIAIDYAQRNADKNNISNGVHIFPADNLSPIPSIQLPTSQFDLIISNPAFHQGRQVDKSMADKLIAQAINFLTPKGRLVIVANRFLNYDKTMREHFNHVSRIAETNKFHVIEARNW